MTDNDQPTYRVGRHNPRNLYRGDEHMGVVFDPADGPLVVAALNAYEVADNPYAGKSLTELEQVMQSDEYRRPRNTDDACPNPEQSGHAAGSRPNMCTVCAPTVSDQCPNCTSPNRHHRFAMPSGTSVGYCPDAWHTSTADVPVGRTLVDVLEEALTQQGILPTPQRGALYGPQPPVPGQYVPGQPVGYDPPQATPFEVQIKGIPVDVPPRPTPDEYHTLPILDPRKLSAVRPADNTPEQQP